MLLPRGAGDGAQRGSAARVGAVGQHDHRGRRDVRGGDLLLGGLDRVDHVRAGAKGRGCHERGVDLCLIRGKGKRHGRVVVEHDHRQRLLRIAMRGKRARRLHRSLDRRAVHAPAGVDDEDDPELGRVGQRRNRQSGHRAAVLGHVQRAGAGGLAGRQGEQIGAGRELVARTRRQCEPTGRHCRRRRGGQHHQECETCQQSPRHREAFATWPVAGARWPPGIWNISIGRSTPCFSNLERKLGRSPVGRRLPTTWRSAVDVVDLELEEVLERDRRRTPSAAPR